jgi:hypothetical protein
MTAYNPPFSAQLFCGSNALRRFSSSRVNTSIAEAVRRVIVCRFGGTQSSWLGSGFVPGRVRERISVFVTAFDPGAITVAEAFAEYDKLHSSGCPIARSERHGGFWLVVGAEAARAVLSDYERFRSGDGVMFPDPGRRHA